MTDEMTMTQKIHEYADEQEATMLLLNPQDLYDRAILGVVDGRVAYSMQKMNECLAESFRIIGPEEGEDPEEFDPEQMAIEFHDVNTFTAYVGPEGPIYIDDLSDRC